MGPIDPRRPLKGDGAPLNVCEAQHFQLPIPPCRMRKSAPRDRIWRPPGPKMAPLGNVPPPPIGDPGSAPATANVTGRQQLSTTWKGFEGDAKSY